MKKKNLSVFGNKFQTITLFLLFIFILGFLVLSLISLISPTPQSHISLNEYWSPRNPPQAHYKMESKINLSHHTVSGKSFVSFKNDSPHPIKIIAFQWAFSPNISLHVSHHGKPLALLNPDKASKVNPPLFYSLPSPLLSGDSIQLKIKFSSFKNKISSENETIKLTQWFPRLWWNGLPNHDRFSVKLDYPEDYTLAISGRLDPETGYHEINGAKTCGLFLGKGMKKESREAGDVLITSLFTEEGKECALLCLETAVDAVNFYRQWLGFYPFRSLWLIPGASQPWGGYPYASAVVVIHGQEKFDSKPLLHWKWITAHEIGHQYWGEYVMDKDEPAWLWIGLGIYADRKYTLSRNLGLEKHKGIMERYLNGVRHHLDTTVDISPARYRRVKFDFNNIVMHGKGYSIISALECVLGEETFDGIYKRCLRDFGGKTLGYRKFWEICEEMSGKDLDWFFNQWVRSNKYLAYELVSQECTPRKDGYLSTVKVKCLGTLKMPVPVKAIFEDGTSEVKHTHRFSDSQEIRFQSQSPLKEAVLDPDSQLAMLHSALEPSLEEISEIISNLEWTGSGEKALKAFKQAEQVNLKDYGDWFKLGLTLFDGGYYEEAFSSFQTLIEREPSQLYHFAALVWMGHLKDLMGERTEALSFYKKALKYDTGRTMQHDQYGLKINREWVKKRLESPFQGTIP